MSPLTVAMELTGRKWKNPVPLPKDFISLYNHIYNCPMATTHEWRAASHTFYLAWFFVRWEEMEGDAETAVVKELNEEV